MKKLKLFGGIIISISLILLVSGCTKTKKETAKVPPAPQYTDTKSDSSLFGIPSFDYGGETSQSTLQLEKKLSGYDLMTPAQKMKYNQLKKKKAQNDKFINQADMRRRGADLNIINILQGGANVKQGDNQSYRSVHSDPETAIKHERWVKEQSYIEIEGLEKENRKYETEMDKILNEAKYGCFPQDTQVIMDDGSLKQIHEIEIGDMVMVYDIGKDQISSSTVNKKFTTTNNHMYILNNSIEATAYERFLTDKGWKKIRDLTVGDKIFDGNSYITINEKSKLHKELPVYNLNINDAHNFFVSPSKDNKFYLIHNTGGGGGGGGDSDGGGK